MLMLSSCPVQGTSSPGNKQSWSERRCLRLFGGNVDRNSAPQSRMQHAAIKDAANDLWVVWRNSGRASSWGGSGAGLSAFSFIPWE